MKRSPYPLQWRLSGSDEWVPETKEIPGPFVPAFPTAWLRATEWMPEGWTLSDLDSFWRRSESRDPMRREFRQIKTALRLHGIYTVNDWDHLMADADARGFEITTPFSICPAIFSFPGIELQGCAESTLVSAQYRQLSSPWVIKTIGPADWIESALKLLRLYRSVLMEAHIALAAAHEKAEHDSKVTTLLTGLLGSNSAWSMLAGETKGLHLPELYWKIKSALIKHNGNLAQAKATLTKAGDTLSDHIWRDYSRKAITALMANGQLSEDPSPRRKARTPVLTDVAQDN